MKVKVTIEVELEVKDRFCKVVPQETSDRGAGYTEVWVTPTDADIQNYVTNSLESARHSFKHENNHVPCRLREFSILETALCF